MNQVVFWLAASFMERNQIQEIQRKVELEIRIFKQRHFMTSRPRDDNARNDLKNCMKTHIYILAYITPFYIKGQHNNVGREINWENDLQHL